MHKFYVTSYLHYKMTMYPFTSWKMFIINSIVLIWNVWPVVSELDQCVPSSSVENLHHIYSNITTRNCVIHTAVTVSRSALHCWNSHMKPILQLAEVLCITGTAIWNQYLWNVIDQSLYAHMSTHHLTVRWCCKLQQMYATILTSK